MRQGMIGQYRYNGKKWQNMQVLGNKYEEKMIDNYWKEIVLGWFRNENPWLQYSRLGFLVQKITLVQYFTQFFESSVFV